MDFCSGQPYNYPSPYAYPCNWVVPQLSFPQPPMFYPVYSRCMFPPEQCFPVDPMLSYMMEPRIEQLETMDFVEENKQSLNPIQNI